MNPEPPIRHFYGWATLNSQRVSITLKRTRRVAPGGQRADAGVLPVAYSPRLTGVLSMPGIIVP